MATNNCVPCAVTTNLPATPACPEPQPCPPRLCAPQEWTCGGWLYKELDGCTTRTRLAGVLPDGVYQNATITMSNGCISAVANGTNILQSRPEPCSTNSGSVTPPPSVTISPAPCNLLSGTSTNLFAGLSVNQAGQNITVSGCGSATSPLVFSYAGAAGFGVLNSTTLDILTAGNVAAINTVGVNYSQCGYSIISGLVKTWTPPITTINAGSGIKVTPDIATCSAKVEVLDPSKTINGVSCGNAFVDPATGNLPLNATWSKLTCSITGSRLFIHAPFSISIYNQAGTVIRSSLAGVTTVNFGTPELADAYMQSFYSFSGQAAC